MKHLFACCLRWLAERLDPQPVRTLDLGEPATVVSVGGQELLVGVSHPYARYAAHQALVAANN